MFDVLVIGGGLAGTVAALAASAEGARVGLASRGYGATALSTGGIDLAYTPALSVDAQDSRTIAEHVMDIIAHRPRHPFGILGLERSFEGLRQGYALLQRVLEGTPLSPSALSLEDENIGLPSSLGTVIPTARAWGPHAGLDLSRPLEGHWGVVQLEGDAHFDAQRLVVGWRRDALAMCGVLPELVEVTSAISAHPPMALAQACDDASLVDRLIDELRPVCRDLAGLIAPPVLGLTTYGEIHARLRDALGVKVVEALAHVPSVPGMRLQRALEEARRQRGIEHLGEVHSPRASRGVVRSVTTGDGREITAHAVVLATGRFIAGGVSWDDRCKESLFELPVVSEVGPLEEDSPHAVVRESPMESHPLMTAGVWINRDLRPLREGVVPYQNLFAAGMVIGGFASRYTLCSDGVAIATGYLAGKGAVTV